MKWKSSDEAPTSEEVCLARVNGSKYRYVEYDFQKKSWTLWGGVPYKAKFEYVEFYDKGEMVKFKWVAQKVLTDPKIPAIGLEDLPPIDEKHPTRSIKVLVNIDGRFPAVGWFDFERRGWDFIDGETFENNEVLGFALING